MCSLYPTDRLNSSVPVVPPTPKINSAAPQMNSNNTSPSHGGSNGSSDKKKDESDDVWSNLEAQASFLGPVLWDNADLKVGNFSILKCFPSLCVCVFFLPLVFHTIEILSRLLRRFIDVERGKKKGTILKMETFLCRQNSFFFSAFRFHAYGSINLLLFSKSYIQCLKRLSLLLRGLKKFHDWLLEIRWKSYNGSRKFRITYSLNGLRRDRGSHALRFLFN